MPMLPLNTHMLMLPAVLLEGKPQPMTAAHTEAGVHGGSLLMLSKARAWPAPLGDYRVYHSWTEFGAGPGVSSWSYIGKAVDLFQEMVENVTTDMLEPMFGETFTSIYVIGSASHNRDVYIRTSRTHGREHYRGYRHYAVEFEEWNYKGLVEVPEISISARL